MLTQKDKIILLMKDENWHGSNELQKIAWQFHARMYELENENYIAFENRERKDKKGRFIFKEYRLIMDDDARSYLSQLNEK